MTRIDATLLTNSRSVMYLHTYALTGEGDLCWRLYLLRPLARHSSAPQPASHRPQALRWGGRESKGWIELVSLFSLADLEKRKQ